ncbi:MAG: Na/Pi cotransporter family protein [Ruminococcus sp.]|nr:Na/Pi cotransporter family protein [Ruminococcus sp.]
MDISNLFELLCGMAMFMFGMSLMGDGLKRAAGAQLERLLAKLTNTPLKGILLGTGVTAVIQSSSATSVMTVGFVNSGMMKFRQAIGIILGSILGTSITGWIIALSEVQGGGGIAAIFSTTTITGIIAVIGFIFRSFSKKRKNVGDIMLGFVVLMVGISTMSGAVAPLSQSKSFVNILTMFSNPVLGILAGTAFTAVLQSASAAVGILQALTATGAIDFKASLPILLGISIGAAVPVLLTALQASLEGKRTAFVYLFINILGVCITGGLFYLLNALIGFEFMDMHMTTISIAAVNTLYRLCNVIILTPFISLLDKLTCAIIIDKNPDDEQDINQIQLEERFLPYPSLAISQSRSAIYDMAKTAAKSVNRSVAALDEYSDDLFNKVKKYEDLADRYENDIGTYLMRLSQVELKESENADVFKFLHTLTDFERITDHCMSIAYIAKNNKEENIVYSQKAGKDLNDIISAVKENMELTVTAFMDENWKPDGRVTALTQVIRALCTRAEKNHVKRLQAGECSLKQGSDYGNLLTDLERIAVHSSKVIMAMLEVEADSYHIHLTGEQSVKIRDHMIEKSTQEYIDKYGIELSELQLNR